MQNCANHRRLIQGIYIILMDDKKIELLDAKKQRTPDTCKSCSVDAGRRKKGVVGASAIIKTDARHLKKILWTLDTPRTPDAKPIPLPPMNNYSNFDMKQINSFLDTRISSLVIYRNVHSRIVDIKNCLLFFKRNSLFCRRF